MQSSSSSSSSSLTSLSDFPLSNHTMTIRFGSEDNNKMLFDNKFFFNWALFAMPGLLTINIFSSSLINVNVMMMMTTMMMVMVMIIMGVMLLAPYFPTYIIMLSLPSFHLHLPIISYLIVR